MNNDSLCHSNSSQMFFLDKIKFTNEKVEQEFIQLGSYQLDTNTSIERLYDSQDGGSHHTNVFATSPDCWQGEQDPKNGIQLHQIHVRDEVDIDHSRRM